MGGSGSKDKPREKEPDKEPVKKPAAGASPMGSTESLVALGHQKRLDPADHPKPIKFKDIQPTICTGDLSLLYRQKEEIPHLGIFVDHVDSDPLFPLLLVKGKTKPTSLESFEKRKLRLIHPVTATTKIFYGGYDRVAIRYLNQATQSEDGTSRVIDGKQAMEAIDKVEAIPFSEKELQTITSAKTDKERSLFMSTFMAAHYYKELGVFTGTPEEMTPDNFVSQLPLSDPIFIKLPVEELGPVAEGDDDPPFLMKIAEGLIPLKDVECVPYKEAIEGLDTGDLVLFTGATSAGAVVKLFDHSEFSHVALVLKTKYSNQLLIWESSTNHGNMVDLESGSVKHGVEVLPMRNKVFSGWYDRVAVRRLLNISPEKREEIYKTMLKLRKEWMGRPFAQFKDTFEVLQSVISPSNKFLSIFQSKKEDLSSFFCSELVAATYQRLGFYKSDDPSNTFTPDDFTSARESRFLCDGVEISKEVYVEMKFD